MTRGPYHPVLTVVAGGVLLATLIALGARLWDMDGSLFCYGETGDRFKQPYWFGYRVYHAVLYLAVLVVALAGMARPASVHPRAVLWLAVCGAILGGSGGYLGPCP